MSPHTFEIETDGEPIKAALLCRRRRRGLGALLVLAHGAGAGQSSPFMVAYASQLAARGLTVATFDFAYMARGRKTPDRAPVLETTFRAAVIGAAAQARMAAASVLIGGKSMGGRIATHLAADAAGVAGRRAAAVRRGGPRATRSHRPGGGGAAIASRTCGGCGCRRSSFKGRATCSAAPDEVREAIFTEGVGAPVDIVSVEGGDHSFAVLKSSGRDQPAVHGRDPGRDRAVGDASGWVRAA